MKLDHLSIHVSDLARSRAFYEALLPPSGLVVVRDVADLAVGFGDRNYAVLAIVQGDEPIQPTHLAFRMENRSAVDRLFALALKSGGSSNDTPGLRPHYHEHYYAAFVLDPDGHNLEFVCHELVT